MEERAHPEERVGFLRIRKRTNEFAKYVKVYKTKLLVVLVVCIFATAIGIVLATVGLSGNSKQEERLENKNGSNSNSTNSTTTTPDPNIEITTTAIPSYTTIATTTIATAATTTNTTAATTINTTPATTETPVEETATITVYSYQNFGEPSSTLEISRECLTLHDDWHKRISSVNTGGRCVDICPYKDCSGSCAQLRPGSLGHNRLRDISFDKRIISVRLCD